MALPYTFKESGLFLAAALMLVGAICAFYSIHLLARVSDIVGKRSYEEVVNHIFGKKVEIILNITIIIFTYGSCIAYLIVIGDTLPPLCVLVGLPRHAFYTSRWFLMFLATVVMVGSCDVSALSLSLSCAVHRNKTTSFLSF